MEDNASSHSRGGRGGRRRGGFRGPAQRGRGAQGTPESTPYTQGGIRGGEIHTSPTRERFNPPPDRGGRFTRGRGSLSRGPFAERGRGGRGGPRPPPEIFAANQPAIVDKRLSTSNSDQLIDKLKTLSIQDPDAPILRRPNFGTLGRPVNLRTNLFAVKLPERHLYLYSVAIRAPDDSGRGNGKGKGRGRGKEKTPSSSTGEDDGARKLSAAIKADIFQALELLPQFEPYRDHVIHDKNAKLVSTIELPQRLEIKVDLSTPSADNLDKTTTYTVLVSKQDTLDTAQLITYLTGKPGEIPFDTSLMISALDLVLQDRASRVGVRVGTGRFFFKSLGTSDLGQGVEAWPGFFMSVRPKYKELMVNINFCMAAFYTEGSILEKVDAFGPDVLNQFVARMKICTEHRGFRTMPATITGIDRTYSAATYTFPHDGVNISVQDYFAERYNITLQRPDLPLIIIGNERFPIEVCFVAPGQAYRGELSPNQTRTMIGLAGRRPPAVNANSIVTDGFQNLGLRPDMHNSALREFGLEVDPNMSVVPARILAAPRIVYKSGPSAVSGASWNFKNMQFHVGGKVSAWAVLLVQQGHHAEFGSASDPNLRDCLKKFSEMCISGGMDIPSEPVRILQTGRLGFNRAFERIRDVLTSFLQNSGPNRPELIVVFLPREDQAIYAAIKYVCDILLGIHTAHIVLEKLRKPSADQAAYFANITLKLNVKFGGINHQLEPTAMKWLTEAETMLVGIDVTHPGPGSREDAPSVVAVVGSVDSRFVHFPAELALQKPDRNKRSKEEVEVLTELLCARLVAYREKNGRLPVRVIVYRDGVSEGQFKMVAERELPRIKAAFKHMRPDGKYNPKLTITICGKRHHTRFYPTAGDHMDRPGNTVPGTIVDKGATEPYDFDFYLQAHAGLQGTVRPTHYTVVYDENGFDADTFQQGTHVYSYLYARATKAVSLAPPAYYADMAAFRGRVYLRSVLGRDDKGKEKEHSKDKGKGKGKDVTEAERETVFNEAVRVWGEGVHPNLRDSMFYL